MNDSHPVHRSDNDDRVGGQGRSRSIGKLGTAARSVVGVVFLYLGIVGLPPIHLLPWWQVLIGLIGAPAIVTLLQLARLQFARDRLDQTGIVAVVINFLVFVMLLIFEPTRGVTLVFLGSAMLFAAARGAGGCEIVAVSNWLLRRDDQIGCPLFWPVDRYEARAHSAVV
jgi:hypothetical protein